MTLRINAEAPNFTTETTQGVINFHEWIGDGWAVLFSHPKDFTPICTTELGYMAGLQADFEKRNCKVIGISIDGVGDHDKWSKDIQSFSGNAVGYPLIGVKSLFSHPKDFTPICTTELGYMAGLQADFEKRNCKVIGISIDGVGDHDKWSKDIQSFSGNAVGYPLIGDPELKIVKQYDMLPEDAGDTSEGRTPADNATARSVFVVGPDKKIKAMLTYPMTTGRNFDEILRILDSVQLTAKEQVATPVNWKQGEDVVILPGVSDEAAKEKYPDGWKSPLPYIRMVPQPK